MRFEQGERRDWLPSFVRAASHLGLDIFIESGLGSGMGFTDTDYVSDIPGVKVADRLTAFAQDIVLMLRCPIISEFSLLRRGAVFISMLHFPTRPERVQRLSELGIIGISLDSIKNDEEKRLVENLQDVAWNGLKVAFDGCQSSMGRPSSPRALRK